MPGIAVIQLNRIGDLHQTLPILRGLETRHKPEPILLICCDEFADALPEHAFAGRKLALSRTSLAKWTNRLRKAESQVEGEARESLIEALRADMPPDMQGHFEAVINLTHDETSAAITYLLRGREKRGRLFSPAQDILLADSWSKYLFAMLRHRQANLFSLVDMQLGIAGLPFHPKPGEAMLPIHAEKPLRPQIAVQLGASNSFRALGPKRFAKALNAALSVHDFDVICVGTAAEQKLGEVFAQEFTGHTVNLQGKTTLEELPKVLAQCRLLVSNDTGTLHVAASVGLPTLGLFFATAHFSETAPYGEGHTVLQAALACSPCSVANPCPVQHCRKAYEPEAIGSIINWLLSGRVGLAPGPYASLELYCSRFTEDGTLLYEPAPGWPTPPRYRDALNWRQVFARRLAIHPTAQQAAFSLPLATSDLERLAMALDHMADILGTQELTPENTEATLALTHLLMAEKTCGPWGSFVAFERISAMTRHAMVSCHHQLASETRSLASAVT